MSRILLGAASALAIVALAGAAHADADLNLTLNAQYYTVTSSGSGDFQTQCCSTDTGDVASSLGPNGLPVYNGNSAFAYKDINSSTNEIQWWTPGKTAGGDFVRPSGNGTITTPFASTSMYPPTGPSGNNGNDGDGFLTAQFTGAFKTTNGTNSVTATLGADDDAYLYLINDKTGVSQLLADLGGVHPDAPAPVTVVNLAAGTYTFDLFYADRYQTQAALNFDVTGVNVQAVPTPEPAGVAVLGAGLFGLLALRRRRA